MYPEKHSVAVTADGDGAATSYTPAIRGRILSVHYIPDGSVPFTGTPNFTITTEDTGQNVWVQTGVSPASRLNVAPRQATHSTAGVAALYAGSGTAVNDYVHACGERVKILIAGAGASKKATFYVVVG